MQSLFSVELKFKLSVINIISIKGGFILIEDIFVSNLKSKINFKALIMW